MFCLVWGYGIGFCGFVLGFGELGGVVFWEVLFVDFIFLFGFFESEVEFGRGLCVDMVWVWLEF